MWPCRDCKRAATFATTRPARFAGGSWVHVSIVGTGMRWTIAEADADIALHGRKLRGCFETSGNEEPPRQPQAHQRI